MTVFFQQSWSNNVGRQKIKSFIRLGFTVEKKSNLTAYDIWYMLFVFEFLENVFLEQIQTKFLKDLYNSCTTLQLSQGVLKKLIKHPRFQHIHFYWKANQFNLWIWGIES